jgi:MoxR-like ATPase
MTPPAATKLTMAQLIAALGKIFPEREDVLRSFAIAACAKEHVLLIGKPGTAKSLMSRTFTACMKRSYFEVLMHAFSTPEEVFGPVALTGLQNDRYIRATKGYAPEAEIVYLDEVFKSNAGMLNGLLSLLNERVLHNDGAPQVCPLMTCIGTSNEFQEGPQLDALSDRFMLRVMVPYIADRNAFKSMLTAGPIVLPGLCDLVSEQAATSAVTLTDDTIEALTALRYSFNGGGFEASDRRWQKSLELIKASAHLEGRTSTEPDDLGVLEHILWRKPDERAAISKLVQTLVSPDGARATQELDNARDLFKRVPDPAKVDSATYLGAVADTLSDLKVIVSRLKAMPQGRKVQAAHQEAVTLRNKVSAMALALAGVEQ